MSLCCKVTGRIAYKVDKAPQKGSTESDSWMSMSLSALKGEAARKREAKGTKMVTSSARAAKKEDLYPLNHRNS